jgi:hypothetical protein
MKTYPNRCAACGRGAAGIHTGPVPPLSEIIARGPAKLSQLDFSVSVCSIECSDLFRRGEQQAKPEHERVARVLLPAPSRV